MLRTDTRNAWLCAILVAAAFMAVNPFVEMPFNDDFSYSFTTKQFLASGHISYNGWSTAALITQILWGALFCKIFGFSYTVLRFSTLPFAMGCAALCYLLARKAELSFQSAVFAAITLSFSPLFFPLATSFMTDVPGLFFILLSLYSLVVAATDQRKIFWLMVAVLAGIIGGMSRQVVWIAPLAVIPYVAFLRRHEKTFVFFCCLGWLMVAANAAVTVSWFSRQPDAVLDQSIAKSLAGANPLAAFFLLTKICLTTVLVTLPAAIPFCVISARRILRERDNQLTTAAAIFFVAVVSALWIRPDLWLEPWLRNTLTTTGILGDLELFGDRPLAQPGVLRLILDVLTIAAFGLMVIVALAWLLRPGRAFRQSREFFAASGGRVAMPILVVFTLAYFAALGPRIAQLNIFDRYNVELIPLLTIPLLRRIPRPGPVSWIALGIVSWFALASTQDVLALGRARAAAAQRLETSGVPRTAFADGLEFNFWTQLETQGYINRAGIANPTHPYDPGYGIMPALCCEYRVEFNPQTDETDPSRFGSIDYISWLPPFHRRIYIDRFHDPWWLDPSRSQSNPIPTYWEGPNPF